MRRAFVLALGSSALLLTSLTACRRGADSSQPASATETATPAPGQPTAGTPSASEPPSTGEPPLSQGAPVVESPDVTLTAPVDVDIADLQWQRGPDGLPEGASLAVLEGTPPFSEPMSFTIALKFPRNYTIPPHQHLVTERVTVLQGRLNVGHGPKLDRKATKPITPGGLILMPSDHTHYVHTGADETVVLLQGVGPWGIFYIDPKDDPRPTPVEKPRGFVSRFDAPVKAVALNPNEIAFSPAPAGMLPPGAQLAILDGDPAKNQNFLIRLKVPDGYKIPVHSHGVTDRLVVISGALMFAGGDTFDAKALKVHRPGALLIRPAGEKHFAQARGETVFQISGTGPFDIEWANPEEDPARQPGRQATARP